MRDPSAVAERQLLFSFFEYEVLPACYPQERQLAGLQLHQAKQQLLGQIAIALDSDVHEMLSSGKSYMVYKNIDNVE